MIEAFVTSAEDLMHLVTDGIKRRAMAATKMNERSSRSHSVLLVTLSQKNVDTGVVKSGKLYLVDLAGSEMVRRTEAAGRRLEEAKMINRSLSTLGNVIHNLTDPKMNHVPYRNSTLTRILQDSFGGNSRTTLIVNISCSVWDSTETLSTLRFGTRAKKIKNQAVINERKSADDLMDIVTMLQRDLQLERNRVDLLKNRLETSTPHENVSASSDQGRSGMRSVPTSAHETAMSSEASTIEAMQQLQKKFKKLEEEYLKVQLESDRRGLEIQDLKARLDSKAQSMESFKFSCKEADKENKRIVARLECSLKTKDSQYSVLQSDHKQLEFKHKELTNHAEKLQQQVDMLSSQGVNRSSLYDIAELQSPGAGVKGKESEYLHAMQQKLVHLVAVQRQLLGKVAASEKNTKEAKRKVTVCDDRIKELRASNRRITERLRKEAEKHVEELIRLRGHISDFQGAQDAHLQSYGHMEEPFIRALRGGGAEGQVDSMEHPRQWDDEVRPIRRGSQCSSTSATSEESLAEVMRIHSDQRL
ncbi:unnamed protein product [Albugo candida]|uniref:Kinesin-like protein n=2 Tax=Albugo candida TaxID=65357 RepID=A0A024GP01_9STRA|nr:unnamed protein product [Albugo candida]|eukprot:CCI48622.1 unnamed protein product [Albugo candida]